MVQNCLDENCRLESSLFQLSISPIAPRQHSEFRLRRLRQHANKFQLVAIGIQKVDRSRRHPGQNYGLLPRLPIEAPWNDPHALEASRRFQKILEFNPESHMVGHPKWHAS